MNFRSKLKYVFLKNKDIFLHNESIIIKVRKCNIIQYCERVDVYDVFSILSNGSGKIILINIQREKIIKQCGKGLPWWHSG